MGGLISVIIAILASIAFYGTGHPILFGISIITVILCFWSWGVMHNYAIKSAKTRWDRMRENMILEARPQENIDCIDNTPIHIASADVNAVPDWLARLNMIFTFIGVVLLIWGLIIRFL